MRSHHSRTLPASARRASRRGGLVLAVVAVLGLLLAGCGGDEPGSGQWLLAHRSGGADIAPADDGSFTLTLTDPDTAVVAFTDRPERRATEIALSELVARWDELFGDDPPNAAVTDERLRDGALAVTLSEPVMVTGTDGGPAAVAFTIEVLPGADGARPEPPAHIEGVTTLIDPPATRLTDFHEVPMETPTVP